MTLAPRAVLCLLTAALSAPAASAATLSFSTASDYDNNFVELASPADTTWTANNGGRIEKGVQNSATTVLYNTTATGGVNGSGGTGVATPNNNTFGSSTMQIDFATTALVVGGHSAGFFSKVNAAGTAGYTAVFRLTGSGAADLRVWDSDANPTTNSLPAGSLLGTQNFTVPAGSFATNTFYTFRLDTVDVDNSVQFTGSIYAQGGAQIGNSVTITDTTAPVLGAGQVGMRFGSSDAGPNRFDNFSVNAVPEPTSAATLLALTGLAAVRRRRGA